jgi:hypothetical protein
MGGRVNGSVEEFECSLVTVVFTEVFLDFAGTEHQSHFPLTHTSISIGPD